MLALLAVATMAANQRGTLSRARQLYNSGQYDAAIEAVRGLTTVPDLADAAGLVLARACLERFRRNTDDNDRNAAREALKLVRQAALSEEDRIELSIALGELLYLDGQAGAAAEQFDLALAHVARAPSARRERLLDWWATALDRQAQSGADSASLQLRIVRRMEDELRADAGATVASYWLAAAARGTGDLERAWDAAIAGWVRASQPGAKGVAARDELDRLVLQAIIPERARLLSPSSPDAASASMRTQWEALKKAWT